MIDRALVYCLYQKRMNWKDHQFTTFSKLMSVCIRNEWTESITISLSAFLLNYFSIRNEWTESGCYNVRYLCCIWCGIRNEWTERAVASLIPNFLASIRNEWTESNTWLNMFFLSVLIVSETNELKVCYYWGWYIQCFNCIRNEWTERVVSAGKAQVAGLMYQKRMNWKISNFATFS